MLVSTEILMKALNYYQNLGYQPIDVPLLVDLDVSAHTKPKGVPELYHDNGKVYVASAEQSFIQLHKEGKLPNGKYMAVTPCYRHECFVSDTHYLMFMKLELIVVGVDKWKPLEERGMLSEAFTFFESVGLQVKTTQFDKDSCDLINSKTGVELGSYGYRTMIDGVGYIYGTGCAFPRVSL